MEALAFIFGVGILVYFLSRPNKKKDKQKNSSPPPKKATRKLKTAPIEFQESKTDITHYFVFDTEATGLPKDDSLSYTYTNAWPRILQNSFIAFNKDNARYLCADSGKDDTYIK